MRRVAFTLAWTGLALSAAVHVASWFGVSLFERFVFLHFGIFVLGIPSVFSARNRNIPHWPPGATWRATVAGGPTWGGKAILIAFVYFAVNMAVLYVLSEGGSPALVDGKHVLQAHGDVIRGLTASEYRWQLAHVSRTFSSSWALAYLFLAVWYWPPRPETSGRGWPEADLRARRSHPPRT